MPPCLWRQLADEALVARTSLTLPIHLERGGLIGVSATGSQVHTGYTMSR